MDERRRTQRVRTLKGGHIVFNHGSSTIDCTVRNLTDFGACLHVTNSFGVPQSFELALDSTRPRRRCRVAWRTDSRLGVSFE